MDSNQKTIKGAQSVYRVLNILEEVILCGDRMITPKELSASLDIPVATVHRLLTVLRQKNFVACDPATKKYHIGDSCLISPRMDVAAFIRARFLPLAERISRRFGYSTILYARSGYDAVCVERLDGWHPIQVFLNKTGDRRPLGMGSATSRKSGSCSRRISRHCAVSWPKPAGRGMPRPKGCCLKGPSAFPMSCAWGMRPWGALP